MYSFREIFGYSLPVLINLRSKNGIGPLLVDVSEVVDALDKDPEEHGKDNLSSEAAGGCCVDPK
jgi:hypothetical protein